MEIKLSLLLCWVMYCSICIMVVGVIRLCCESFELLVIMVFLILILVCWCRIWCMVFDLVCYVSGILKCVWFIMWKIVLVIMLFDFFSIILSRLCSGVDCLLVIIVSGLLIWVWCSSVLFQVIFVCFNLFFRIVLV